MVNQRFHIIETESGEKSLMDDLFEERLHPAGPVFEAYEVYIAQSKLMEKLQCPETTPLVLFDIGLGAASNSLAAFETAHKVQKRPLRIISFESHMEVLQFVFDHRESFPHIKKREDVIKKLLDHHQYQDEFVQWDIHHGDFQENLYQKDLPSPQVIYHDMYSPKKNPIHWGLKIFKKYIELCQKSKEDCVIVTYSQATAIRAAMLDAGFFVGHGQGLGMKRESTVASTDLQSLNLPLSTIWLEKWKKSSNPYPSDVTIHDDPHFHERILKHPQFYAH